MKCLICDSQQISSMTPHKLCIPVQKPNAAEEANTPPKPSNSQDHEDHPDSSYDVTAPVNREQNLRRSQGGSREAGSFNPTTEWVRAF